MSRYPTFRRRFDDSIKIISEDLAKKNSDGKPDSGRPPVPRSRSALLRIFSQKSFKSRTGKEPEPIVERDVEIA